MTDHITLESLALEISKLIAARDGVTKHDPRDSMDMTILATLHKIGHPEKALPGVRPHILKMVIDGEITVYSTRGALQPVQTSDVSEISFDKWRTSNQDADKVRLKLGIKSPAKPGERESALGGVETAKAESLPLTTGDIAFCFAGLRWETEAKWKKPLGDKPKWLAACIAIPGVQGVSETRWNPVLIGAALANNGHAKPNSIRAKFQTMPQLSAWLETWKTYEAEYLDSP